MRTISAVLLSTFVLNGCFAYVPAPTAPLQQGQSVQVFLNTPQDVRLTDVTANNITRVDGEVVSVDSAQLVLSAALVTAASGVDQLGGNATVVIPRGHVDHLQQKRFSPIRSVGLVGLVVLLTALTASQVVGGGTDSGGGTHSGS
ncbi:MAG: hypothetical protein JWM27_2914 [Gemmatimonadetes bacterium]|nr:hypothetical protein [Gemmatimonadota bacterium]